MPLLILTIVPAGRVWALDGRLRWPAARAGRFSF
jgi:hypothetical protein